MNPFDSSDTAVGTREHDSALERAYAQLVRAIDAQEPGNEARYLARLALLLLHELHYSPHALLLIEAARSSLAASEPAHESGNL